MPTVPLKPRPRRPRDREPARRRSRRGRPVNPVDALREIGFLLERTRSETHRVKAYRRAADIVAEMDADERARHVEADDWKKVAGIGPKTALVIGQASAGTGAGLPAAAARGEGAAGGRW